MDIPTPASMLTQPTEEITDIGLPNGLVEEAPVQSSFQDPAKVEIHPELVNLAENMDEAQLSEIGSMCWEEFQEDEGTREDWLKMQADWVDLYYQKHKPSNPPWSGSSEVSLPILIEGCNQFHARAYKSFFSKPNFVSGVPVGNVRVEDRKRAERIGKYMSWELDVKDKNFRRNKDRLLRSLPLHGSVFTKTYRDHLNGKNVIENVRATDLVVSYHHIGMDIEEIDRKTHIIIMPMRKAAYLHKFGFFTHVPEESIMGDDTEVQENINKATGISEPTISRKRPCKILEQHRFLDLDGDGLEEPYIVWLDATTQKVLRISIRYSTDAFGTPTNNKAPLEFFTHYVYLENPDGFYGLGIGHMTGDINKACNVMLRQAIDAATLQNMPPGFYTKTAGIGKGEIKTQIGKLTAVDSHGMDDIRKSMMFMDTPGPSTSLINMMTMMSNKADRLNMVTDMLTGAPEKVYQPTTAMAMIEQGLVSFTAIQTRIHAALEQELAKLYRLNSLYLDEQIYFSFNDVSGTQDMVVYKDDFKDDVQVKSSFDPSQSSEEVKMKRAQAEYDTMMRNPLVINSPMHLLAVTRRYLEAIGSVGLDEIIPTQEVMKQRMQAQEQGKQQAAQAQQAQVQQEGQLKMVDANVKQGQLELDRQVAASKAELDRLKIIKQDMLAHRSLNEDRRKHLEQMSADEFEAFITQALQSQANEPNF